MDTDMNQRMFKLNSPDKKGVFDINILLCNLNFFFIVWDNKYWRLSGFLYPSKSLSLYTDILQKYEEVDYRLSI